MPPAVRSRRQQLLRAHARARLDASRPERGLSRREFLRIGVVGGLGLLVPGCSRDPGTVPTTVSPQAAALRVGIVGAGLAGLTAAYWLHRAGVSPRVYEAADRIGGRCWSARGFDGGQVAEHGGEFIDTRHVHLRSLAEELELQLDDLWESWETGSTWLQLVDGEVTEALEDYPWLRSAVERLADLAALGPLGSGTGPAELVRLDEMTAEDWYRANVGPTDDGEYRLWARELAAWFGLDPERLGAGTLIDYYTVDHPGADGRYTISGGNDQVPSRIAAALPGDAITVGAALEAVVVTADESVELHFGGGTPTATFDRVVLALPFPTLREVDLSTVPMSATLTDGIADLAMGTNAKVLLQFDRPFFGGFGSWSGGFNRADDPLLDTWESGSTDGGAGLGLLTVFSGGRVGASYDPASPHGPAAADVVAATLAAVEPAAPGLAEAHNGRAWLDSWVDDPWTKGSYAAFGPGQTTRFWGALAEPQGPVHIAGEHTSTFSQGFLNGGVESGCRAATEIMAATGLRIPTTLQRINDQAARYEPIRPHED